MTTEEFIVWRNLAVIPVIVGILWTLAVLLCREWVKSDLNDRLCRPIHVRWLPFSWRNGRYRCAFRVMYADALGQIHRALCWTFWHRPSVTWISDEIIGIGQDPTPK